MKVLIKGFRIRKIAGNLVTKSKPVMVPDVKFRVFQSNDLPVTVNIEVFIVVFQYSNTISLNIYFPYEIKIILKGKMKSESLNESIFQTNF